MATPISTEELAASRAIFQVVDVRRRPAFDGSAMMISGAVWGNPEAVDSWVGNLDPCRVVAVYCVHGHQVSQSCAAALEEAGINAWYLEGGFDKWAAESRPTVTKSRRGGT